MALPRRISLQARDPLDIQTKMGGRTERTAANGNRSSAAAGKTAERTASRRTRSPRCPPARLSGKHLPPALREGTCQNVVGIQMPGATGDSAPIASLGSQFGVPILRLAGASKALPRQMLLAQRRIGLAWDQIIELCGAGLIARAITSVLCRFPPIADLREATFRQARASRVPGTCPPFRPGHPTRNQRARSRPYRATNSRRAAVGNVFPRSGRVG